MTIVIKMFVFSIIMITIFNFAYGQNQTPHILIKVLNESNIPIEGAIIYIDSFGKSVGSTDSAGSYIIKKQIKYIGYILVMLVTLQIL